MRLRDYDFTTAPTVRKRCIHYAKDGNKVVKHWRELYPLEVITGHPEFAGLYLEHEKVEYSEYFRVYNDLGADCIQYDCLSVWYRVTEEAVERLNQWTPYIGLEGYKKWLEKMEAEEGWINNAMIRALTDSGETELAVHYRAYHQRQLAMREEKARSRKADQERREQEEAAARQAQQDAQIQAAEQCILNGGTLQNEQILNTTVVLFLMKKHGIIPPLRTQGWINERLVKVSFLDNRISCTYHKSKGGKCSMVVFDCLAQLRDKVEKAHAGGAQ